MSEPGGWLWLVVDVAFVVVLGAALVWGTMMWRSRRERGVTEQATKDLYRRGADTERRESGG